MWVDGIGKGCGGWCAEQVEAERSQELTGVNAAKCQPEQSIIVNFLREFGADCAGQFDRLSSDCCAANADSIRVDVARGAAAVAVRDRPSIAIQFLG